MGALKSRKWVVVLGALVVLAGACAAIAYWSGSGSGTASSGGTVTLTFKAANATTSPIRVATVHLVSVTADAGHSGCVTTDFTMADVAQVFQVPAGATAAELPDNGSLAYADTAIGQDACKSVALTGMRSGPTASATPT